MMVENGNSENTGQGNIEESQNSCSSSSGGDCGCSSGTSDGCGKRKLVVFVIILAAAGIILARSFMKESNVACDGGGQVFAGVGEVEDCGACPEKGAAGNVAVCERTEAVTDVAVCEKAKAVTDVAVCEKAEAGLWRSELDSLSSLNTAAVGVDAVFVFLGIDGLEGDRAIEKAVEAAAKKIEAKGSSICAFRLKKDSAGYAQLAKQFSVPCVVAMVKGGGMSAVSGEINETKLVGAFVKASRPSSCGPSGCGPTEECPK